MSGATASLPQPVAEPFGLRVEADDRQIGAEGEQRHARPMLAERGIAGERAAEHIDGEERAGTVADDHHLIGLALAHRIGHVAGEYIQPLAPIPPFAVDELVDGGGLVAALQQSGDRFAQPEQGGEAADPGDGADNFRNERRRAERGHQVHAQNADERAQQQPCGYQQYRKEGDQREAPIFRSMRPKAPLRSATPMVRYICTIFHQRRPREILADDVFPAQEQIAGLDLPAVAVGGHIPGGRKWRPASPRRRRPCRSGRKVRRCGGIRAGTSGNIRRGRAGRSPAHR